MIPHHSITFLSNSRANITGPRAKRLADGIIKTQPLEIDEMKALILDMEGGAAATPAVDGK